MQIIDYKKKEYFNQTYNLFLSYPNLFPRVELLIAKKDLETDSDKKHEKLIIYNNNEVLGYVALANCYATDYSWQIQWLVVHPKHKRKGIASKLIRSLFNRAKDKNLEQIFIETCSCDEEKPARKFYESVGFEKIAVLSDYYQKNHSKVIYIKKL